MHLHLMHRYPVTRPLCLALVLLIVGCARSSPPRNTAAEQTSLPTDAPEQLADWDASNDYLSLLPEGETKRRFILDCTGCHQFDRQMIGANGHLKSKTRWEEDTRRMLTYAGAFTGFPVISPSHDPAQTAAWLVEHLGDETNAIPIPPRSTHTVEAAPLTVTEYDLPAPDVPHDLVLDAEGNLVITGQITGNMYVLSPETGTFETLAIPVPRANPRALTIDQAGDWWVLLGGPEMIARYRTVDQTWETWPIGMHPHSIVRDDEARIWFNGHFSKNPEQMGYLDPTSDAVKTYDVPSPTMPDGGSTIPYGLRIDPDGILWGTQLVGGRLIRFDPHTETFKLYLLPTPYSGPRRPDIAEDGTVWIPAYAGNALVRFDPQTESFTEYQLPIPDTLPYIVRVDDTRGWVWIASAAADAVFRFFPDEERFDAYHLPTERVLIRHMELDESTGALWLSYANFPPISPKIVRLMP